MPSKARRTRAVPVLALTGHLGAGKTTLLNRILLRPGGRVGVVVNDFGAVNIDAGLVSGQIGDVRSFAGGCICHLEDDSEFDDALEQLSHPRLGLDAIVVEASGIAEPTMLSWMIRHSGAEHVRPGGMVEVVDAVNYFDTVDRGGVPPSRFTVSTLVVLNKCDLIRADDREDMLAAIEERIHEANPGVPIVRTSRGLVDPELLFDVSSPADPDDQLPIAALLRDERSQAAADAGHLQPDHAHPISVSVETPGPIAPEALIELLRKPPAGAYRVKGSVAVDLGRTRRGYVAHIVGRHAHLARRDDDPERSQLVAIGVDFDRSEVAHRLASTLEPAGRSTTRGLQELERLCRLSR